MDGICLWPDESPATHCSQPATVTRPSDDATVYAGDIPLCDEHAGEYDADEGVPGAPPMRLLVADHVRMCAEGV